MKKILAVVAMAVMAVFGSLALGGQVMAAQVTCPTGSIRAGDKVNSYAECNVEPQEKGEGLMDRVQVILNVVTSIVGLAAVAAIIIGGVTFITSQGDAAKVMKGKNTIMYGVIGLIVAILSFAIVNFVLSSVFSAGSAGGGEKKETTHLQIEDSKVC